MFLSDCLNTEGLNLQTRTPDRSGQAHERVRQLAQAAQQGGDGQWRSRQICRTLMGELQALAGSTFDRFAEGQSSVLNEIRRSAELSAVPGGQLSFYNSPGK